MAANRSPLTGKRLDSWKEIAAFFGRAERTVKRWETERGLPVHRVPGSARGSVFAYSDELAEWLKGKGQELAVEGILPSQASAQSTGSPDQLETSTAAAALPSLSRSDSIVPLAPQSRASAARLAAWLIPLALAGALIAVFSVGNRALHFKALADRHAPNAEAQDLYLKGRYYWERRTPEDLNKAIDYFTQAIVKDPSDAQAYVGLADCYNLLREFGAMPATEAYPRALAAAQRAVELDNTSAEAYISLAFPTYWWSWKGVTAEQEFKRALALDPKLVRAHHWYATYLYGQGRFSDALDQMEQARRLDPSSTAILADKGSLLWAAGRQKEGLALLTQLAATEPSLSSTHAYLAHLYWDQEDYARSLAESRQVAELRHDKAGLAIADACEKGYAENGLKGLYESELPILKDLVDHGSGSAYALATAYAALGKRTETLAYLQTSFDRHEAAMLIGDPIPEMQNDPAYQKFRAEVKRLLAD